MQMAGEAGPESAHTLARPYAAAQGPTLVVSWPVCCQDQPLAERPYSKLLLCCADFSPPPCGASDVWSDVALRTEMNVCIPGLVQVGLQ